MHSSDYRAFSAMLDGAAALLQRQSQDPLTAEARAMYFRALADHPLHAVRAAFDAHVKDPIRGRFVPTPADLIAQIRGAVEKDGRPGAEEAWSIALGARDEAGTVVWTAETAEAWGVASAVLQLGDEVGARMAFREAYTRLVDAARERRQPVAWSASLGFDDKLRTEAVERAVSLGRLPRADLLALPRAGRDAGREGAEGPALHLGPAPRPRAGAQPGSARARAHAGPEGRGGAARGNARRRRARRHHNRRELAARHRPHGDRMTRHQAREILDGVRAGADWPQGSITRALQHTGDLPHVFRFRAEARAGARGAPGRHQLPRVPLLDAWSFH